uniref:Uncharacterized protein n=1 Tax=Meloidogyne floridensis TaxID=298350 RepID=A0A915NCH4_9BILA
MDKAKLEEGTPLSFQKVYKLQTSYNDPNSDDEDYAPDNKRVRKFCLTELSVLIQILKEISIENLNEPNKELIDILKSFTNLIFDHFFGNEFYKNLGEIIDNYKYIYEQLEHYSLENKYKNIFIIWHLFAITRKVIQKFALFQNSDNYYKIELGKYNDGRNIFEEISMFGYAEAYDIFEVKANFFMNEFRKSRYFYMHFGKIIYEDDGIDLINLSLQAAEMSENIIYNAEFEPYKEIERHPQMGHFWPLIYKNKMVHNTELVLNECKKITIETLDPNSLEPEVPFYVFFYKLKKETKDKLQQIIINKYFIDKFVNEKPEYIEKDCIELIPMSKKLLAPPQKHLELVKEVRYLKYAQ